jgi:hypothetical protein
VAAARDIGALSQYPPHVRLAVPDSTLEFARSESGVPELGSHKMAQLAKDPTHRLRSARSHPGLRDRYRAAMQVARVNPPPAESPATTIWPATIRRTLMLIASHHSQSENSVKPMRAADSPRILRCARLIRQRPSARPESYSANRFIEDI